jgi:ABC-type glycerol-3-phosphate transport system substrate-binding protein
VEAWTVWDGTREALMNQQIEDFQRLVPAVTVKHSLVQQAQMYDKYTSAIAGGTSPDSVMVHGRMLPAMADKGQLLALDPYVRRDGLKPADVWYEPEWQGQQWQGKAYGLPLASGGGRPGFASGGLWTQYLSCNGGRLFSQDLRKVAWNGPEGVEAAQFELDLERRLHGGRAGLAEALGGQSQVQAFASGKLSMLNNGVYFAFYELKQLAPDLPYGAATFPHNGGNPRARSLNFSEGGWGYCIPQGARNPEAAWEWQKYACAGEGNLKFFLAQGRPTPVKRHNERPEFRQASPYFDVLVYTLHNQTLAGVTPAWPEIRSGVTQMVADVGTGKVGPKDGLDDGARQAQLLLDRFHAGRS